MGDSTIGRMAVDVGIDLSDLEAGLETAKADAAVAGQAVADALSSAVAGNDLGEQIVKDLAPAQDAFAVWQEQIAQLVASGSTIAEAMASLASPLATVAEETVAVGQATQQATAQLQLFDDAMHVPFADAAGQLNLFATELEDFSGSTEKATESEHKFSEGAQAVIDRQHEVEQSIHDAASALSEIYIAYKNGEASAEELARAQKELADATHEVGEKSHEAESGADEFLKKLLEFAGITISIEALREFATEAFNLYAAEERAGEGLAFLRGNAAGAEEMLQELRGTAQDLALPFESVLKAAQNMAFFKLTTEQTTEAMAVADDVAKASGKSFDSVAASITNISLTGMVMPRTLKQIGLEMKDLAEVMQVSVADVTKTFKDMAEGERLDTLIAAMQRTRGASALMADDTTSNLTRMKNSWEFALTDMGSAIAPLVVEALPQLTSAMKYLASAGVIVISGFKQLTDEIKGTTSIVFAAIEGYGKTWAKVMTGDFAGAAASAKEALSSIKTSAQTTFAAVGADAEAGLTALDKIWQVQVKTAKDASTEEIAAAAAAAAAAAKAAAARIASAKELQKELKEVQTFAKAIAPSLAEAAMSEDDYLTSLLVGGKTASAIMKELTQEILKGEQAAANMSGAPLAAMNAWIAKLKEARIVESDRSAMDEEAKSWTDILNKRAAYEKQITEEATKLWAQVDADVAKSQIMQEQGALAHKTRMLEIERSSAAELAKAHSITMFDELAIDQEINAKEVQLERDALTEELKILDDKNAADIDYASKRIAILQKISAFEDKTNGKAQVDAINAQTIAYRALGLESEKALTTQIKEADQALKILQDQGAAIGLVYAGQEKELGYRIKLDELTGTSATKEIIGLKNIQIQQQALYDQTHMMGDLYVGVMNDILKGWDTIGKSIADNIIEEQNWGKMFLDIGKQIGKMILEDIVGTYMKALKNSILGVTDDTNKLGLSFSKLGSLVSKVFGGSGGGGGVSGSGETSTESHTLPTGSYDNQSGESSGAGAGTTGSSGGGIISQMNGLAGIIGTVAQLINGIVQDFQLAHIGNKLGEIEINTRGTLNQLVSLQESANQYWPALSGIMDYLWHVEGTWLIQIENDLFQILGVLTNSFSVLTLVASSLGSSAGPGRSHRAAGEDGTDVLSKLQDLLDALQTGSILSQYSGEPGNAGDHQISVMQGIADSNQAISTSASKTVSVISDGFTDLSQTVVSSGQDIANAVGISAVGLSTVLADSSSQLASVVDSATLAFVSGTSGLNFSLNDAARASADSELLNNAAKALADAQPQAAAGFVNYGPLTPQSITTPTTPGMQAYNASVASGATPVASNKFDLSVAVTSPDEKQIADVVVGALETRGFKF